MEKLQHARFQHRQRQRCRSYACLKAGIIVAASLCRGVPPLQPNTATERRGYKRMGLQFTLRLLGIAKT
jgi:hypothetical protein